MLKYVVVTLIIGLTIQNAEAQSTSQYVLRGEGHFLNSRAIVEGQLRYDENDYKRFNGMIRGGFGNGRLIYEGYENLSPYDGIVQTTRGNVPVAVLDDAGGQMIIYKGEATLGPPTTLGEFYIQWEQVR